MPQPSDLTAACSGFLFAVVTAAQYLRSGAMQRILVVGADQLSRWVDWDDRRSCVLFGDAAGAVVMEASDEQDDLQGFLLRSDGGRGAVLQLPQSSERAPLVGDASHQRGGFEPIQMNGQEVYKFAVREVPAILEALLPKNRNPTGFPRLAVVASGQPTHPRCRGRALLDSERERPEQLGPLRQHVSRHHPLDAG